jgi:hypothetical protein
MARGAHIVFAGLAGLLIALTAGAVPTGGCGPALAAQDLAGTCRRSPATPGALEAEFTDLPVPVYPIQIRSTPE